ncbi:purine nucleoside permease [[Candida] railenensis]|uniref:Purine nucleoside permease n=1 Tax=[Candida] railenensis TaxID=45579 RepID=A0A9P0QK40_9ASCO|nr:purine nucleoside permease [[Candida] railenensis]
MKFSIITALVATTTTVTALPFSGYLSKRSNVTAAAFNTSTNNDLEPSYSKPFAMFQPKVLITSMFEPEAAVWLEGLDFIHNMTLPGLSPLYPDLHCTSNYSICQVTTGEGEINAAATIASLTLNPLFDFSKTYVLIAGIAGGEPNYTTTGSVTFSKYTIQVANEYQIDSKELVGDQKNWTTGYFAYGTDNQDDYPANVYGTEVFELNENLLDRAIELAKTATLDNGTNVTSTFRKLYKEKKGSSLPQVEKCDGVTSDTYFTGNIMGDYFDKFAKLMTNGSATYCATAQEDNASLEAFVRADKFGLADYERIIVMRTISDFARPPASLSNDTWAFFTKSEQDGFAPAIANIFNAGLPIVTDILSKWDTVYKNGHYKADNYVGDIYGTLGGTPDFGKPDFEVA